MEIYNNDQFLNAVARKLLQDDAASREKRSENNFSGGRGGGYLRISQENFAKIIPESKSIFV